MRRPTKRSTAGRMPRSARANGDKEKPRLQSPDCHGCSSTDRIQQGQPHGICCGGMSRHPGLMIARVQLRWLEAVRRMSAIGTKLPSDGIRASVGDGGKPDPSQAP